MDPRNKSEDDEEGVSASTPPLSLRFFPIRGKADDGDIAGQVGIEHMVMPVSRLPAVFLRSKFARGADQFENLVELLKDQQALPMSGQLVRADRALWKKCCHLVAKGGGVMIIGGLQKLQPLFQHLVGIMGFFYLKPEKGSAFNRITRYQQNVHGVDKLNAALQPHRSLHAARWLAAVFTHGNLADAALPSQELFTRNHRYLSYELINRFNVYRYRNLSTKVQYWLGVENAFFAA